MKLLRRDTVIIDNPVHENEPVDPIIWLSVVRKLRPTIAVLPDVIDDDSMTIKQAKMYAPMVYGLGVKLMAVPHGDCVADFYSSIHELVRISGVTHIGLSLDRRLDDEKAIEQRYQILRAIKLDQRLD